MQSRNSVNRSILNQVTMGAGGLIGNTVPVADYNRTVGTSGFNAETNPVQMHDDSGSRVNKHKNDGTYRPAHFEVVQSWRRDPTVYPDNYTFRLNFSQPLRNVHAIEVVEMNAPNVDGGASDPAFRQFLLLNGILTEKAGTVPTEYGFHPQGNIAKDRSYHTMIAHNSADPNIDHGGTDVDTFQIDDFSLARFNYDSTKGSQYWRSDGGYHQTTYFPTPITRLAYLDLTLADSFGDPYVMDVSENWTATLQILSEG